MIDIGENIREIRKLKGMTQKELGNKLGISQSAINQFENNKTAPKLQTIEKLAIALEVSMYDILKRSAEYYQPTGVNLDINIIKNALHSHEAVAETPLDKVTVTALKELLEYKETGLTPQDIKEMDKMYLEKCKEVNALVKTCERLEKEKKMNKQDIYTLCTLIPSMDDYSGHNMYLCGKRDGFNECVKMLKENLKNIKEEAGV